MLKRILDVCVASIALLVLSPVLIVVAVLIKRRLGSPILFKQMRPGLNGELFQMIKFRSMRDAYDANGEPLPNEQRLTPFGKKLRATSVDELPELWNVIKGDMSLVGPRPLLAGYLPLYNERQKTRHNMRPGVTGWAQVNGRNAISWEEKFEYDAWYVENQSFWLDLKILCLTVKKVFFHEGISHTHEVTMPRFTGSSK